MTPNELLQTVKTRFSILLHDDEAALNAEIKKAIGTYQDLAGFMAKLRINDSPELRRSNEIELPERFASRLVLKDAAGRFVSCEVWGNKLELGLNGHEQFPLKLLYLENLLDVDFNSYQLPVNSISLIADYLYLLICKPNSERLRKMFISGKLDVSDIPLEADINTRITELEQRIKDSRAIMPSISLM